MKAEGQIVLDVDSETTLSGLLKHLIISLHAGENPQAVKLMIGELQRLDVSEITNSQILSCRYLQKLTFLEGVLKSGKTIPGGAGKVHKVKNTLKDNFKRGLVDFRHLRNQYEAEK